MFNFAAPAPISARAEGVLRRSVEVAFDFVGAHFFENCRRWHPQVVEVEVLSGGNGEIGATARQITFDRGIRSEFKVRAFGIRASAAPRAQGAHGTLSLLL